MSPVRPASIVSSIAIGNPADGDLAIATAETSGGAIYAVPEDEVGANISLLAETAGIFGEGATGVAVGALREAVARGELGERDRVVVLVTGTGLKTPQLARAERRGRRDRARRRRAARGAGGDGMTDAFVAEPRDEIDAIDRELLAAINRRLETRAAAARLQAGRGPPAPRPRARGVAARRRSRRRTPGRSRPRASPSFFEHVLELTRRELHGE